MATVPSLRTLSISLKLFVVSSKDLPTLGTEVSNPLPSSGESANFRFLRRDTARRLGEIRGAGAARWRCRERAACRHQSYSQSSQQMPAVKAGRFAPAGHEARFTDRCR